MHWIIVGVCLSITAWGAESKLEPRGQVVGFYTRGKIKRADHLQTEAKGYIAQSYAQHRVYGSLGLVHLIEDSTSELVDRLPYGERVHIGDLSAETGGRIFPHASHQNGLDADIFFVRTDNQKPGESLINENKTKAEFDLNRNWTFVKLLMESGRVSRIFVNSVIKRAFCDFTRALGEYDSSTEILRRIRPWNGHEAHMHVRLNCPKTSKKCESQTEPPLRTGCEETAFHPQNLNLMFKSEEDPGDEEP